ncbi:cyclase family protein [Candidatus Finniella inopinata]|uniref:Cyclase family protein n=1 Tax=Candidatus Finniella inopinata TaxID=1696036 RepID=A0A4Q7DEP1_9PROT|nr:cyclase family protein [Candidatus Finniella inopinata]RZI45191.1 cyclase family protein [Candidatus Finniella inopinata]
MKSHKFPYTLIDLTHTLTPDIPTWTGGCGFHQQVKLDYDSCETDVKFRVQQLKLHAGIGTHIDAPAHCIPGGQSIDQLSLDQLSAPCAVIDVSGHAHERYTVTPQDILDFEHQYGSLPPHAFVIINTGWERFWTQPDQYRNNHIFPCVGRDAAQLLLDRAIAGLGIDTLSPDRPTDGFPVHQLILGAGKYIVENVAHALKMPRLGAYTLALPIKTQGGTEAPARLVGLIPT